MDVPVAPGKVLRGKRLTPDYRGDSQAFCCLLFMNTFLKFPAIIVLIFRHHPAMVVAFPYLYLGERISLGNHLLCFLIIKILISVRKDAFPLNIIGKRRQFHECTVVNDVSDAFLIHCNKMFCQKRGGLFSKHGGHLLHTKFRVCDSLLMFIQKHRAENSLHHLCVSVETASLKKQMVECNIIIFE